MKNLLATALLCLAVVPHVYAADEADWLSQRSSANLLFPKGSQTSQDVLTVGNVLAEVESTRFVGHIEDGNYIYRSSISAEDSEGKRVAIELPQSTSHDDPYFGVTEIYEGPEFQFSVPASTKGPLSLHWQGCAKGGVCFPSKVLKIDLNGSSSVVSSTGIGSFDTQPQSVSAVETQSLAVDEAAAQKLAALGPVWGPLLFFGFGLLLAFTPCSLPMVPIVASMVARGATPRRATLLASSYVVAMALSYAAIGVLAGLAGANVQAALQTPWLLSAFAALFVVLAASLFGAFEISLPSWLIEKVQASSSEGRGGLAGAFLLGLISALMVGPCMTAPLAGALLYIGQTGSALRGGAALFMLGIGMGVPLILVAAFGAQLLPKPGVWMERVRVVFAYFMLGLAVEMLSRFLPSSVALGLWGSWGLGVAVGLQAWSRASTSLRLIPVLKLGGALSGIWAMFLLIGAASGHSSLMNPLKQESQSAALNQAVSSMVTVKTAADVESRIAEGSARGQWTLVDFYADWCTSCHHNERSVFGDDNVQRALVSMQVLKPDVTANDAEDQALMRKWNVQGPPTLLLIGPDGKERRAYRSVGETTASEFLDRLEQAMAS